MTVDDDNSIYVGGLPYDATEESLRLVFDLYGSVVAVKIVNDRAVGGKCYGFVTFRNPRSAIDAINDMNGRTIDGRVVRVNEVKTRGGRPNFNRDNFRRNTDVDWDRSRNREKNYDHDRGRYRDRDRSRERNGDWSREPNGDPSREHNGDRSRERISDQFRGRSGDRDWSRDREQGRERGYERAHEHDQTRDHLSDKDRDQTRDLEDNEQAHSGGHGRYGERDDELDSYRDKDKDRTNDHGKITKNRKDQQSKKRSSSSFSDRHSEHSSYSSSGYHDQVKEQVEISIQRCEELQKEILQMEEKLQEKQGLVLTLQNRSLKLENALTTAKKLTSSRQMRLTKLHKCFVQVQDCNEKLKSYEQELQGLVDTTKMEIDSSNDIVLKDVIVANGSA